VKCIRLANRLAGRALAAAREGFARRQSERRIHTRYLEATGALDAESPYPNIIAWDDRSAILHYQRKRVHAPDPGHSFLIDAGASVRGYASDVTRSYVSGDAHPVFREALDRMETLQQALAKIFPGLKTEDLPETIIGEGGEKKDVTARAEVEGETETGAGVGTEQAMAAPTGSVLIKKADYQKIKEYYRRTLRSQELLENAFSGYKEDLKDLGDILENADVMDQPATKKKETEPAGKKEGETAATP